MFGEKTSKIFPMTLLADKKTDKTESNEIVLKGIPSSPGMANGRAFVIMPELIIIPNILISVDNVPAEISRLETGLFMMIGEIQSALDKVKGDSQNISAILETNLLILNDEFFLDSIKERIKKGYTAESAVVQEYDEQIKFFKNSKDGILQERSFELEHLKDKLLATIRKKITNHEIPENSIIVAQSITPTDVVHFKELKVIGIITEAGGIASHSSMLARSFGIPAVIGVRDAHNLIQNNFDLIIDGYAGLITISPSDDFINSFKEKKSKEEDRKRELGELIKLNSETEDGIQIKLSANIDSPDDVKEAVLVGCEGIGLVRTENLVMSLKRFPDEEEQYKWYKEIADRAYPNPVVLRAFDIGSDKYLEGLPHIEQNPALGFRGIRFLLHREDIFANQLRAFLRASANKNLKIMLPMISSLNEIEHSKILLEKCKKELSDKNVPYDMKIPLGIMIETPSAALLADKFADAVDFFSIGTNDLTQYTLAVDRTNEFVTELYDTFHPSVLKLIKNVVDSAKWKKIPVSICGELAGHAAATGFLVGIGIDELSVPPGMLLELKKRIRELNYKRAKKKAREIINSNSSAELMKLLEII
ncbi:MAG: phosphoenolpyruvate--protein phosphotransferase [Bacteroidetes bacterium]|nr:MAG: phosphoenolpyruvate--protein phosphotransferase [Bacteroidota bacterium]